MNCAPRGSVTGGREVADKRELYKIGCRPRIRREGEGAPYGESGRMPVGHPVGASNAIFHRSRLSSKSTKRSLSLFLCSRLLSRCRRVEKGSGRGGGGRGEEGGRGTRRGARRADLSNLISRCRAAATMGARYGSADTYVRSNSSLSSPPPRDPSMYGPRSIVNGRGENIVKISKAHSFVHRVF